MFKNLCRITLSWGILCYGAAIAQELSLSSDDELYLGGYFQMVLSFQMQRDICQDLFPENSRHFIDLFSNSILARYTNVFGTNMDYRSEFSSRDELLNSLQQTEEEALNSCNIEYQQNLEEIEALYQDRIPELIERVIDDISEN